MDKRAVILALDARRRVRDARKEAGISLSEVKRAISAELRRIAASVPKAEDVAALVKVEIPAPTAGADGEAGKDGKDGRGVTEAEIAAAVAEYLKKHPIKGGGSNQSLLRLRQKVADTTITATLTPAITFTAVTPYAVTASDGLVIIDSSGGAKTVTMPPTADVNRQIYTIKRMGSGLVTINRSGADTFDQTDTSVILYNDRNAVELCADSARSAWWVK